MALAGGDAFVFDAIRTPPCPAKAQRLPQGNQRVSDELSLTLMRKIRVKAEQAGASDGDGPDEHTSSAVTHRILMLFRPGRVQAAGVYEYADDRGTGLWSGLAETFPPIDRPSAVSLRELSERMLFAEALEAVACPDEGVIAGDASVARCWAPASRVDRRRAAVHQRL